MLGRNIIADVYDPSYQDIGHNVFMKCDWSDFHYDIKETTPISTKEPRERKIVIMQDIMYVADQDVTS